MPENDFLCELWQHIARFCRNGMCDEFVTVWSLPGSGELLRSEVDRSESFRACAECQRSERLLLTRNQTYRIFMKNTPVKLFSIVAMSAAFAGSAMATNSYFATGDLLLTFQKVGSVNTVYADLGSAASFRGASAGTYASNKLNIADLNTILSTAFGAGWASDPSIYTGVAGVYSVSNTSSSVISGDASRTLYVSAARSAVGSVGSLNSSAPSVATNTDMTGAAGSILAQNSVFADVTDTTVSPPRNNGYDAQVIMSPVTISRIDDKQPIITFNSSNYQDAGFGVFAGGIQQQGDVNTFGSFGVAGTVEFALDLYRIVAVNGKTNSIDGTLRSGDYQGTITVNSSGKVSFVAGIAAPTATPFETWIAGYPSVTSTADKAAEADPDGDGFGNLTEFVLGGDPTLASASITPTLSVTGGGMALGFYRSAASVGNTTAVVQYSTDLSSWSETGVTTPSTAGFQTVSIPSSSAANGKLFTRLKVTRP